MSYDSFDSSFVEREATKISSSYRNHLIVFTVVLMLTLAAIALGIFAYTRLRDRGELSEEGVGGGQNESGPVLSTPIPAKVKMSSVPPGHEGVTGSGRPGGSPFGRASPSYNPYM
jgi:hypothetical protein